MKTGDTVKVIKSIDDAVPVESKYIGAVGVITAINTDRPAPVSVEFVGRRQDAFWPEELRIIKNG